MKKNKKKKTNNYSNNNNNDNNKSNNNNNKKTITKNSKLKSTEKITTHSLKENKKITKRTSCIIKVDRRAENSK